MMQTGLLILLCMCAACTDGRSPQDLMNILQECARRMPGYVERVEKLRTGAAARLYEDTKGMNPQEHLERLQHEFEELRSLYNRSDAGLRRLSEDWKALVPSDIDRKLSAMGERINRFANRLQAVGDTIHNCSQASQAVSATRHATEDVVATHESIYPDLESRMDKLRKGMSDMEEKAETYHEGCATLRIAMDANSEALRTMMDKVDAMMARNRRLEETAHSMEAAIRSAQEGGHPGSMSVHQLIGRDTYKAKGKVVDFVLTT